MQVSPWDTLANRDLLRCSILGCDRTFYFNEDQSECELCGADVALFCQFHFDAHFICDCPAYLDSYAGNRAVGLVFELLVVGDDEEKIQRAIRDIRFELDRQKARKTA